MINEIINELKEKDTKAIESLRKSFMTIRTGKVQTSILDGVMVDYYGTPTSLSQIASVLATDAKTITITPWEKPLVKDIEKALNEANIGVNPNNDGECIKLYFSAMTVEQREESAKRAKSMGDDAKVVVRNNRQDSNNKIKNLEKEKEITSDESKSAQDDVQKITTDFNNQVDSSVKTKQEEVRKV